MCAQFVAVVASDAALVSVSPYARRSSSDVATASPSSPYSGSVNPPTSTTRRASYVVPDTHRASSPRPALRSPPRATRAAMLTPGGAMNSRGTESCPTESPNRSMPSVVSMPSRPAE